MAKRSQAKTDHGSRTTTDPEEIRRWVEARGGKPATVKGTEDDDETGILRIDFPGYSGADSLQEIPWEEFFEKFEDKALAFLHQDRTADGQESRFFKLVRRQPADEKGAGEAKSGAQGGAKAEGKSRGATKAKSKQESPSTADPEGREAADTKAAGASKGKGGAKAKTESKGDAGGKSEEESRSTDDTGDRETAGEKADGGSKPKSKPKPKGKAKAKTQDGAEDVADHGSRTTTDPEEIRRWVEARGGKPATVKGTEGDDETGILRIDFPGYSGADSLQEIPWEEFFEKFEEKALAFLHQDRTADGQESRFFKLVRRQPADQQDAGETKAEGGAKAEDKSRGATKAKGATKTKGGAKAKGSPKEKGRAKGANRAK